MAGQDDNFALDVVARAFPLLEALPPQSLEEETENARLARGAVGDIIEDGLRACDWSFASVTAVLVRQEGISADPDLPYKFSRPDDMLRLIAVLDDSIQWQEARGVILADVNAGFPVRYTARLTDVSQAPADFRIALAYGLAARLAPRILGSARRAAALMDEAERKMRMAKQADARSASQRQHDGDGHQDWVAEALRR